MEQVSKNFYTKACETDCLNAIVVRKTEDGKVLLLADLEDVEEGIRIERFDECYDGFELNPENDLSKEVVFCRGEYLGGITFIENFEENETAESVFVDLYETNGYFVSNGDKQSVKDFLTSDENTGIFYIFLGQWKETDSPVLFH